MRTIWRELRWWHKIVGGETLRGNRQRWECRYFSQIGSVAIDRVVVISSVIEWLTSVSLFIAREAREQYAPHRDRGKRVRCGGQWSSRRQLSGDRSQNGRDCSRLTPCQEHKQKPHQPTTPNAMAHALHRLPLTRQPARSGNGHSPRASAGAAAYPGHRKPIYPFRLPLCC